MDHVTLASITSAVAEVALEAAKEDASRAAKDYWAQIKKRLGWEHDPAPNELALTVATTIGRDPAKAKAITAFLQERPTAM